MKKGTLNSEKRIIILFKTVINPQEKTFTVASVPFKAAERTSVIAEEKEYYKNRGLILEYYVTDLSGKFKNEGLKKLTDRQLKAA